MHVEREDIAKDLRANHTALVSEHGFICNDAHSAPDAPPGLWQRIERNNRAGVGFTSKADYNNILDFIAANSQ